MSKIPEIYCRQPKTVELISCQPNFQSIPIASKPELECRSSAFSSSGSAFAYTQPNGVYITDPSTGELLIFLDLKDTFDFHFSPSGTFITTWSKPVKSDDNSGNYNENVKVWKLNLSEKTATLINTYLNQSQSGWKPQFTSDETKFCRLTSSTQIEFFKIDEETPSKKSIYSLNLKEFGKIQSFQVSPGKNPSIAVFIPENKGKPSFIKVFSLPNVKNPITQKQFFKGETCQFRWNALGTSLLALVSTDVDATNKSYYGETTLYLLGISGSFDQRIDIDKNGPIHDITWSPTSREFAVIHGFMPAATTFFDARGNSIHSLPPDSRNTILYSPHAKYILVAGFGNLQGDVDILDRTNQFKKVTSFQAANTSVCKWSPDGRYILTATTSPRLRVDNCVKVFYANGTLCYVKQFQELNSCDWRFQPLNDFPPIKDLNDCCAPHISAVEFMAKKIKLNSNDSKPAGAYIPPHARRAAASGANGSSSGTSTPKTLSQMEAAQRINSAAIPGFAPKQPTQQTQQQQQVPKIIPGASAGGVEESKAAAKNRKKRANKLNKKNEEAAAANESVENNNNNNSSQTQSPSPPTSSHSTPDPQSLVVGGVISLEEKKIRSLLKKLRAIELLKDKQFKGSTLEDTQILKIKTEDQIRKELHALGWSG